MKTLIIGGDGFRGWPTALHLSARGHDAIDVDGPSRHAIDLDRAAEILTPITLEGACLADGTDVARRYARRTDPNAIRCTSTRTAGQRRGVPGPGATAPA